MADTLRLRLVVVAGRGPAGFSALSGRALKDWSETGATFLGDMLALLSASTFRTALGGVSVIGCGTSTGAVSDL